MHGWWLTRRAAATEWRQVALEAFKAAVVLAILERCFLTSHATWLEDHVDYMSLQVIRVAAALARRVLAGGRV
jgi:hypothetical protein